MCVFIFVFSLSLSLSLSLSRCSKWHTSDYHYIGGYYGASTPEKMMQEIYEHGPIAVSFEVYL